MKVKELIWKLGMFNPELEVMVSINAGESIVTVDEVDFNKENQILLKVEA